MTSPLLLTAANVLPNAEHEGIGDGAIVVEDGVITYVGSRVQAESIAPAEALRLDLADGTLLPGLIDSHVHLGFDGSEDPVAHMVERGDHELLLRMADEALELLDTGVTTARELGARGFLDIDLRSAIAAGYAIGPRLVVANRPITTTGGHCWFMGGEADTADEVRKMARLHIKRGADVIKIMATGGFMTGGSMPWSPQFSTEEIRAAVYEAHRLGRTVAAHAHGTAGIRNAVEAGVDTIEHCTWVSEDGIDFDLEVVEAMARGGVAVCPTTNCGWHRFEEIQGPEWTEGSLDRIAVMRDVGVTIVAGTDAGINLVPHGRYLEGLDVLRRTGMTPTEVLASATIHAARSLGVAGTTGALEAGKSADIIGVRGDPTADLTALGDMPLVVAAGRIRRMPERS